MTKSSADIAKLLGRSIYAVNVKGSLLGLKRPKGIVWTDKQLYTLRALFPTMFNRDLAKLIGVSQRTMIRKARELGLSKTPTFHEDKKYDIARRTSDALKRKRQSGACWPVFEKGNHYNPEGEFKPGNVESPETKAKRSAALKRAWARKKLLERLKPLY